MGVVKLFRTNKETFSVKELSSSEVKLEKELQKLIEQNLEEILGIAFLATEYPTSKSHSGRLILGVLMKMVAL